MLLNIYLICMIQHQVGLFDEIEAFNTGKTQLFLIHTSYHKLFLKV